MPQDHVQNTIVSTGTDRTRRRCKVRAMIKSQGFGLIAELVATVLLIAALTGLSLQRSKPWLVGAMTAFMILVVAATVVIASST